MRSTRFRARGLAVAGLVVAMLATACGSGGSSGGGESSGPVELRFSWWGNNDRAAITQKALDAFMTANPNIKVKGEFTDFNGYFDDLPMDLCDKQYFAFGDDFAGVQRR